MTKIHYEPTKYYRPLNYQFLNEIYDQANEIYCGAYGRWLDNKTEEDYKPVDEYERYMNVQLVYSHLVDDLLYYDQFMLKNIFPDNPRFHSMFMKILLLSIPEPRVDGRWGEDWFEGYENAIFIFYNQIKTDTMDYGLYKEMMVTGKIQMGEPY